MGSMIQLLERKGFLSSGEISNAGKKFYETLMCGGKELKLVVDQVKKEVSASFVDWWNIFPTTDGFEYKNKKFPKTGRVLRQGEDKCKIMFTNLVAGSSYTAEDIIEATKAHIEDIKQTSYKTGKNGLTYLPASQTYLNKKVFLAYIGETKKEELQEVYTGFNG